MGTILIEMDGSYIMNMDVIDKRMMDVEENKRHYTEHDFDEEWRNSTPQEVKDANKKLVEKFPFLIPTNRWSGQRITDGKGFWPDSSNDVPKYDYEYTELDEMPIGWRKAFGEQMCQELKDALVKDNILDKYRILQIKEKYGALRWYSNFDTEETAKVISKYENLSEHICVECGAQATQYTLSWISPYCDECAKKIKYDKLIPASEYWQTDEDDE